MSDALSSPPQPPEDFEAEENNLLEDEEVWCPEPATIVDLDTFRQHQRRVKFPSVLPSQFTEFAFRMPNPDVSETDPRQFVNFSFEGRRHMLQPYDTPAPRILLFCARQVEKCGNLTSAITLANGYTVPAQEIRVGQRVACLDVEEGHGTRMTTSRVAAVSPVRTKPGVRILTRQGHLVEAATTHPVRIWDGWREAGQLKVGDRIAAVRRAGEFGVSSVPSARVELTAFMLGNGGLTQPSFTYSGGTLASTERFLEVHGSIGGRCTPMGDRHHQYRLHVSPLYAWMREDGQAGKYSYEKTIPAWVFDLGRAFTALFLNRLWATDGHVKQNTPSKYAIEYASTSRELTRQVQALLWKFGIPSCIRENQPSYVCVDGEPARLAYILRVETQEGVHRFLTEIGALGKSEGVSLPKAAENNNRDTYPPELCTLIRKISQSRLGPRVGRGVAGHSLRKAKLRETLEYPPTRGKLRRYVDFFRADPSFDQALVDALEAHLTSDLYWDVVESLTDMGPIPCVDLEVEVHHNFLIDGVVTHNSTLLGNKAITYSCLINGFRTLYVSPSSTQTKTFSQDRIKDPLETSTVLRAFTTTALQQNVFEKQFSNRSKITLRYAFLNADRCAIGSTRVHFTDGSVASLHDIYENFESYRGRWVWSADREALAVVPARLEDAVDQGKRSVVTVRLEDGAVTTCTPNQPLLTWAGWKKVEELTVGTFVAVPRKSEHGACATSPVEEYRLAWARIEEICPAGIQQTYDLTIGTTENYMVDGLFIHNTRGIPGWGLMIDELQDILGDSIPIIEQCLSHAPERWKRKVYAGTPKSFDNILEEYRTKYSTQGEWVVPCDAHGGEAGRYWNILAEKNIGKKGLICERCGGPINPQHPDAQWANMVAKADFEGYRIPQLMVPWRSWDEILLDYRRYPRDKFYNEVLGLSYDSGMRPLSWAQIQQCCHPQVTMHADMLKKYRAAAYGNHIYAGLDWGTGENSYTVLALGMYVGAKFRIFYIHRFEGEETDPVIQMDIICRTLKEFNVRIIGADYGGGFNANDRLIREFGVQRVQKYQYLGRCRKKVEFEPRLRRWKVFRTEVMSDVFNAIKRNQLEFPRVEEFREPFAQDMLNIFSEYNETLRMTQYSHGKDRPDDSFHAIVYCLLASMIMQPRPDIISPNREEPNQGALWSNWSGTTNQG